MYIYLPILLVLLAFGCTTNQTPTPNHTKPQHSNTELSTAVESNNTNETDKNHSQNNEQAQNEQNISHIESVSQNTEVNSQANINISENNLNEIVIENLIHAETPQKDIKILHFSSWEASLLPQMLSGKKLGGFAYLTQAIKNIEQSSQVILCTTGNFFRGDTTDRRPVVKALNMMGLSVCNISNLELNYGPEDLQDKLEEANFTTLCANVYQENKRLFPAYTIVNKNNKKIAFIGIMSREAAVQSIPQAIENLVFRKPINELQKILPNIKTQADFVVVISNLRHSEDIEIARKFSSINLIVGRYDVDMRNLSDKVNNTLIVRTNKKQGVQLGEVTLSGDFTPKFHDIGPDSNEFNNADPQSNILINEWQNLEKIRSEILCKSLVYLDGEYSQVRQRETELGNLLADVILATRSEADVAIINSGAIRASIAKGDVTYGGILDTLPYKNKIVGIEVTGKTLKEVLENAVARYEAISGSFLQVGGMSFSFSQSEPMFSRISNVKIQGEPLTPNKLYKILTLDYIASGGDDYIMLKDIKPYYTSEQGLPDIIANYLRGKNKIDPRLEQRIVKK
ncbi:bifunctional UDP-sugar hydrolase/5'-nucleotidase [Candidatus Uabimicrobium sp. HlEnr_7]|uniref:bifunctional metallophosphatase/5'-nucleotidase n=1 Tax=Candidatus Uabimicrobium helgolandensis TaxID=3095367 RepID=UPI0035568941